MGFQPDDVLFPEESGEEPSILILECSSTAYMSSLRECSLLQVDIFKVTVWFLKFFLFNEKSFQDFISKTKTLTYCVHFTRKEVLQTAEYSEWMSSLGESCKHIILNGTGPALPHLEGAHKQQGLLRSIAPFFFHALKPEFEGLITQVGLMLYSMRTSSSFSSSFLFFLLYNLSILGRWMWTSRQFIFCSSFSTVHFTWEFAFQQWNIQ